MVTWETWVKEKSKKGIDSPKLICYHKQAVARRHRTLKNEQCIEPVKLKLEKARV